MKHTVSKLISTKGNRTPWLGFLPAMALILAFLVALNQIFISGMARAAPPAPNDPSTDTYLYLPMLTRSGEGTASLTRGANAPYFPGNIPFAQTAVFWFGRVNPTENYTDVRVGYNDQELYISTNTIDRRLWYDASPSASDLMRWDSVSLYLNTNGNTGEAPGFSSYHFAAQLNNQLEDDSRYELSARGDGTGWAAQTIDFYSKAGWRGEALNNNYDDKGWAMTFRIPFASLGLSGPPPQGSRWGLALALHDRDDSGGTPIADQVWPPAMNADSPATWGQLGFGLPVYTPPPVSPAGVVTIRHRLNGATVQDAGAGGYTLCGGSTDYWTQWGDTIETFLNPEHTDFNVANEADISNYPCFSKYYATFPLDAVPAGKRILSATLTLHLFGNAGAPRQAQRSLIQVLTVNDAWSEADLTWNNAPLAWENVSQAWVEPVLNFPGWPGVPWTWDVSYAVAQAYNRGQSLNLALYSADGAEHSGKYFSSSDTGDWNAVARPTLVVTWGEP